MKNCQKEKERLEEEFKKYLKPGIFSEEEIKEKEEKGIKILTKLVDDDILCRLFELGKNEIKKCDISSERSGTV